MHNEVLEGTLIELRSRYWSAKEQSLFVIWFIVMTLVIIWWMIPSYLKLPNFRVAEATPFACSRIDIIASFFIKSTSDLTTNIYSMDLFAHLQCDTSNSFGCCSGSQCSDLFEQFKARWAFQITWPPIMGETCYENYIVDRPEVMWQSCGIFSITFKDCVFAIKRESSC